MKVGIYSNPTKEKSAGITEKVISVLKESGIEFTIISENSPEKTDMLIVIGGDGTILKVVDYIAKYDVPVLTLNAGKLGFLAEFSDKEAEYAVKAAINGELKTETAPLIEANFSGKSYYALNEVVIQRLVASDSSEKTLKLNIAIKGKTVENLKGDGVIIATQKGSTAYSLSAGGTILSPGTDCFELSPICSHSFNNRSIVYPTEYTCTVKITNDCKSGIIVDGIFVTETTENSVVEIKKSSKKAIFYKNEKVDYYEKLFMKMK